MKNPFELLRAKEQEVILVRRQVEALRLAATLLDESKEDEDNVLADRDRPGKPVKLP